MSHRIISLIKHIYELRQKSKGIVIHQIFGLLHTGKTYEFFALNPTDKIEKVYENTTESVVNITSVNNSRTCSLLYNNWNMLKINI